MKLVVIGVEGVDPGLIFEDDRLTHVRALAEEGIVGRLAEEEGARISPGTPPPWEALDVPGPLPPLLVDGGTSSAMDVRADRDAPGAGGLPDLGALPVAVQTRTRFRALRLLMGSRPWDSARLVDAPRLPAGGNATAQWASAFDEELGRTLEALQEGGDELSLLLVVLGGPAAGPGAFALISSLGLPSGTIEGARLVDLAPTLAQLAGRAAPVGMTGSPLPLDRIAPRFDDEEAVLERLRGLGYLS